MESLEEQLYKLNLLNNESISPPDQLNQTNQDNNERFSRPGCSKVAAMINTLEGKKLRKIDECSSPAVTITKNTSLLRPISPKKVGPLVPPKPTKKKHLPEVPQSSIVKKTCEPLYSKRLQSLDNGLSQTVINKVRNESIPVPRLLQKKQAIYATQSSFGEKSSAVTLDNPDVLEQQLEALTHHKKQLEKKGLLQQQDQKTHVYNSCVPKLSSTSLINEIRNTEHPQPIYSNFRNISSDAKINEKPYGNIYNNVEKPLSQAECVTNARKDIYCNLMYKPNVVDDFPPPPPPSSGVLTMTTPDSSEYLRNLNYIEDEIPPPPSPVSSSYSELRRATESFSEPANAITQLDKGIANSEHYVNYHENSTPMGQMAKTAYRKTYINTNYSNDYTSYSPTLQTTNPEFSDYYGYGSFSQGSSTYESIYEPINPRPPSQISMHSNYMLYTSYVNGPQVPENGSKMLNNSSNSLSSGQTQLYPSCDANGTKILTDHGNCSTNQKEAEVEALTDFLVHSIDKGNDIDSYGICFKCNERVLGENSGCTAMDQIYHIVCFTCSQCQINLQGKPFYALDGKPFCEYDYLQTLEKCSVCMKPILERILRATGKPYHPQCFTCIVCGQSLDGIPFTVDATNQNYCIVDFHKKFAPRCCVCKEPIMPEPGEEETVRVVALDRSFHFICYKCEDCGLLLSSEAEGRGCYPLDDHVLCKSCNAKRVQMLTNRMTIDL